MAQERALQDLEWALKEHAANVMRIVRGAGKPHEIGRQCVAIIDALRAHHAAVDHWPPPEVISQALDIDRGIDWSEFPEDAEGAWAEEAIIRAALQTAASRLVRQRTQETSARNQMHDSMRRHEEWRNARIARWRAEEKAASAKASTTKRPKRVAKPGKTDRK